MRRTNQPSALPRPVSVVCFGAFLVAMGFACLNPLPEEFPSHDNLPDRNTAEPPTGPTGAAGTGGTSSGGGTDGSADPGFSGNPGSADGEGAPNEGDSADAPDAGTPSTADGGTEVGDASP